MRVKLLVVSALFLLVSCAKYKLLKPEPLLSPDEKGYVELKDKKKDFELKKDKKYFIIFPAPQDNNFYLVLTAPARQKFNSFLTNKLLKKKIPGDKIKDETADPAKMSVYPIDKSAPLYYWCIDNVKEDVVMKMEYRYAPQWRFKFENKHAEFKATLEKNRVDRTVYTTLGTSFHFNGFNFTLVMDTVGRHTAEQNNVLNELLAIESIFPKDIVNSTDEAYLNYKKLRGELEEEIVFQKNYMMVLDFFDKEYKTRGNPMAFIELVEDFIKYFALKNNHPANVVKESQTVLNGRLAEIVPFYDQRLSGKDDAEPFDMSLYKLKEFNRIGNLYDTAGLSTPAEFNNLAKFVNSFDKRSNDLSSVKEGLDGIQKVIKDLNEMPSNTFFTDVLSKMATVQKMIPQPISQEFGKYFPYKCSKALNDAIAQVVSEIDNRLKKYRDAEMLVPQVNVYKDQQDYKGMLSVLKPNIHLDFLVEKYKEVDKLSLQQQDREIRQALSEYRWAQSEAALNRLHHDNNFLNPSEIFPAKDRTVRDLEDSLYTTIDRVSRTRINKFLEDNVERFENIDSMYADSVFYPAYNVTFSTGSKRELLERKTELIDMLAKTKENEFPAKAVKLLYEKFIKNPDDNGVLRARAIVAHGEHYKGDDQKIKQRIAECNPWLPKWITEPKEYRKAFALPTTDNKRGVNTYVIRFNIRIPTEAKFPVYDVNIKLPKEVAKNAAAEQWYEKMLLNKTLLKNEGRFTISAPTAENDYECQISPMSVDKDGNNVLDIYFKYNAFKVLPISVMAQKPIIKKH